MTIEHNSQRADREVMRYDVVVVGAGPAGLACAIKLKQLAGDALSVCVLEKASTVGAHAVSGAVLETRALDELLPNWRDLNPPKTTPVVADKFLFLTKNKAWRLPTPPQMHNKGNVIVALSQLTPWLGDVAASLGVEIFAGFAAAELLQVDGTIIGVATGDMGLNAQGEKTDRFVAGVEIHAQQVVLAEGCHGSLTQELIAKQQLRHNSPQTYGLGIKEVWQIDPAKFKAGLVVHSLGWPMDTRTYGGGFVYHFGDNMVSLGFVVGLDYTNPHLSPFNEMQRWKTHPSIKQYLEGGKRVAYAARALVEGGWQALPQLAVKGALLVGDAAGFLNVPKIKGNHTAMKSGLVAATSLWQMFEKQNNLQGMCETYWPNIENSWLKKELYAVRNIRPAFKWGLWAGLLNGVWETLTQGLSPWTLKHHADHTTLQPADKAPKIAYDKPDGVLTFDRLSSVFLANLSHDHTQPKHLQLRDATKAIDVNFKIYDSPETRYCPAGVYEIVHDAVGNPSLQINAQNCVHCKTCDIKDPTQNIHWVPPEGGSGPNYGLV